MEKWYLSGEFYLKQKMVTKENIVHFIEKHKNQLSISKLTRLFGFIKKHFLQE
ncbi:MULTISPECIES: hypothetical protein [Enterococcus]|uniref:hypothetical protein n=1 Tax=Enterococcus TaxID=1350 RepID=UPI00158637FF|nr:MULTISPECIES: hypothetical protein [Enterococcus]MCR1929324.1 hypothetical protein [Enterococcus gallinarum]MCR1932691.1 hypothetical protein [Enterococcus gallinarum]MCR1946149.1 hypothetical protein [Enterococcus gallinarum]MDQ6113017.1 hypothetical protein [Enterococcus gallinarum]MDV7824210.1 hypothetical protein [Enterococcus gallinarum]